MARITYVKRAQQRYATVPVIDPETGEQKVTPVLRRNGEPKVTKNGKPVVMRVTVADKSKPLPPLNCEKCREPIEIGTPYKWIKPKTGPYGGRQRNRHAGCPTWRPSEVTGSAALSTLYAAQEAAEDAVGGWSADDGIEALEDILRDLAEGVREAGETYRESGQNIEDGFGHETYQSAELLEKAEALDAMADEVESAADFDEFDEDVATEEAETEVEEVDPIDASWVRQELIDSGIPEDELDDQVAEEVRKREDEAKAERDAEVERLVEDKRDEWAEEQRSKVEDAISMVEAP